MAKPIIAVIAAGAMGSAVGARLAEHGVDVVTSLPGRSRASLERAERAGMRNVTDGEIAKADIILSILPPSEALPLAERLALVLRAGPKRPLYIDCNAVSSATMGRIAATVAGTGCRVADGGIIGPPPRSNETRTILYISGVEEEALSPLSKGGLQVRALDGPIGAASALKMGYAGITKGLTAIASASILGAARSGAAKGLWTELSESQPALLTFLERSIPDLFPKAYRFVGEMEEVAQQGGRASSQEIYGGMAKLYREIAADFEGPKRDVTALTEFIKRRK